MPAFKTEPKEEDKRILSMCGCCGFRSSDPSEFFGHFMYEVKDGRLKLKPGKSAS